MYHKGLIIASIIFISSVGDSAISTCYYGVQTVNTFVGAVKYQSEKILTFNDGKN